MLESGDGWREIWISGGGGCFSLNLAFFLHGNSMALLDGGRITPSCSFRERCVVIGVSALHQLVLVPGDGGLS